MENWLGRSLKHKLSLLIIISVLVPVLSLGLFSYNIAAGLTEEKAKNSGMNTLRQIGAYLENMVSDVENQSLFLIGHADVQNYLKTPERNLLKQTSIINLLTMLSISKPYIANVIIESNVDKPAVSFKSVVASEFTDIKEIIPNYYSVYPKWWSSVHLQITSDSRNEVITMSRPIRSTQKYYDIGMLKISLLQSVISAHLKQAGLEGGGIVLLLDGSNRILAGPDDYSTKQVLEDYYPGIRNFEGTSGSFYYGENADRKAVLYYSMSNVNWKLVGITPVQSYKAENKYFLTLTAVAVTLAMLFVIAFVLFLIQKVTKPLSQLTKSLKRASPDEPLPMLQATTIDEVGQLIITYNRMSSRIVKLNDEVKRNEALKKEADMSALQAQINPHFLYNTLSSVHWMALMKGDAKIAEMVGSLSDFLRFSLNKGQEYCAISQEILHIDHYVNIQSIRYPDKFEYEADIPSELLDRRMLKLLLQPLIENAMIHGILTREGKGHISVKAWEDGDNITFTVEDDGVGMGAERLEELRDRIGQRLAAAAADATESQAGSSYGLRNVHNRLLLHYGPDAGLHIESTEGDGTKVTFTILPSYASREQERVEMQVQEQESRQEPNASSKSHDGEGEQG
ncbi:sensor histidine kinase [Paenibacillus sp. LHD-117]|uniref:sensor histidine kinase n=1 Tax=Paenibacillus sp. LHD-117 TaxID=3071412 RepID=UPI0027E0E908|nr:sensor histidine kinase [Paenibacillus sp. LHD-117]MDQ6418860.1 sensor histidine kinase [Paenibacillus sp. LHD-117]